MGFDAKGFYQLLYSIALRTLLLVAPFNVEYIRNRVIQFVFILMKDDICTA